MLSKKIFKNKISGFTLIETLIFLFIFSITGVTFYKGFAAGTKAMSNVRSRLGAIQLANEKIEVIHNLKYEDVGTVGGIPDGEIPNIETVVRSNKTYYVRTSVVLIDDPFDGTFAAGTDIRPADYKQVKVVAFWEDGNPEKSANMVTTISPPGVEAMYTGGILSLNVVDSSGLGVSQANIRIVNNSVSPAVNAEYTTDLSGNLFLPEVPSSVQGYAIEVWKNGYFPAQTYAPFPISSFNPVDVHASVVVASINQQTIVLDKISNIKINVKSPLEENISEINFSLEGGRQMGNTLDTPPVGVWLFPKISFVSNSEGKVSLTNISPGPYYFEYSSGTKNDKYKFLYFDVANIDSDPLSFNLVPESTLEANLVLADKETDSLVVTVLNDSDNKPIQDASIQMRNESGSYDVTLTTNRFGKVYFPDSGTSLDAGDYKLNISCVGFTSLLEEDVTINRLTLKEINLSAE
ncbi:MAG: hypothetical protein HGA61_00830 [Candidatus Moranbacteria bacterium]|nr:hypothetical protein [Candidatus Moranbacteria bacterium]